MSTVDETPWRRALRAYPASWRARHGEAMLGTLLDEADANGRTEPTRGERLALIRGGLAVRIGGWMPPTARTALATASAGTGFALALTFAVFSGVTERFDPALPIDAQSLDPQASPGLVPAGLWVVSFALILLGAPRTARIALGATVVAAVSAGIYAKVEPLAGPGTITTVTFGIFALLALLAPVRSRLTATAIAAPTSALLVSLHVFFDVSPGPSSGVWLWVLTEEFTGFLAGAAWVVALLAAAVRAGTTARHLGAVALVWTIIWLVRLTMWDVVVGILTCAAVVGVAAAGVGLFRAGVRSARGREPEPLG